MVLLKKSYILNSFVLSNEYKDVATLWPSAADKSHEIKVVIKGAKNAAVVESCGLPATWRVALLRKTNT